MTKFWESATQDQRLKQIDAGIELFMTARQIAMNCGATKQAILSYGHRHGRKFPAGCNDGGRRNRDNVNRVLMSRRKKNPEVNVIEAFEIFGARESFRSLFDARFDDGVAL